ncbi:hypothetical protein [Nitratireductor sp. B36]|uniref:hypothetical protein n=1 Tax=Nitratireductor sp. B36 TaxID=2762059 RepID=UPI001E60F791|nr:hypothetical protein [Nitratireductor sp. B36]
MKDFELLLIALQDGGMQRNDLEGRWSFLQLCKNRLALMVEFSRAGTDHIRIANTFGEMIDQTVDLALELLGAALKPNSISIGLCGQSLAFLVIGLHVFGEYPGALHLGMQARQNGGLHGLEIEGFRVGT